MKEKIITNDNIELVLLSKEVLIIQASLNEVCNGIDIFEFETRLGASKEEVKNLLKAFSHVLDKLVPTTPIVRQGEPK